jgi:hypothetical protein
MPPTLHSLPRLRSLLLPLESGRINCHKSAVKAGRLPRHACTAVACYHLVRPLTVSNGRALVPKHYDRVEQRSSLVPQDGFGGAETAARSMSHTRPLRLRRLIRSNSSETVTLAPLSNPKAAPLIPTFAIARPADDTVKPYDVATRTSRLRFESGGASPLPALWVTKVSLAHVLGGTRQVVS